MFAAGLPFLVPEILEFKAFRENSGKIFPAIFPEFSRNFPQKSRTDPGNSHSLLEFSEKGAL